MSKKKMNCFQVNKYITLRLEDGKTNIYVNGSLFKQCKFLLLEIPVNQITSLNEIESIDEAAERLGSIHEIVERLEAKDDKITNISPETEFWGHASNLQVWSENQYATRLLHSNLAFPLLKKLTEVGDPLAEKVFAEEILKRLESGYPSVIQYLVKEKFINYISRQDLFYSVLEAEEAEVILDLEKLLSKKFRLDDTRENLEEVQTSITISRRKVIKLQIVGCKLKDLPECIKKLKYLKHLYLNGNDFVTLPEWIGEIKNLESLDVSSCELESIPEAIGKLSCLNNLFLSNNYFQKLPNILLNLKNLEILTLNENEISYLPNSIDSLKNLKLFNVVGNPLKTLPKSLLNLKSLEKFFVGIYKLHNDSLMITQKLEEYGIEIY